jgi:hypothetical protein
MDGTDRPRLDFSLILKWKRMDYAVQLAAFVIPFLIALFAGSVEAIFLCYFTVGAVQVISCICNNIYLHPLIRWTSRKYYESTLVALLLIGLGLLVFQESESVVIFALAMLLIGIIMAFWYFAFITIGEIDLIKEVLKRKAEDTAAAEGKDVEITH